MRFRRGNDAALGNFDDVIAERFRHGVQGQGSVDEALNEFEAAHCSLLLIRDEAETSPSRHFRHELHREPVGGAASLGSHVGKLEALRFLALCLTESVARSLPQLQIAWTNGRSSPIWNYG